ncbi:hypothetical protein D3C85_1419200 [compost metagenome]
MFYATDGYDFRVLHAFVEHHRKHIFIENERIGVQQKYVVGINTCQRHVECFAMRDMALFRFGSGSLDQVDPVKCPQVLCAFIGGIVVNHPYGDAAVAHMLMQ